MKSITLGTALVLTTSLFAQVALADEPCGNYGISTEQEPCAMPQQPVNVQPQQLVNVQPQQAPCAPQQTQQAQAPMQAPMPRYGFGLFRPRYNAYGYQQPLMGSLLQNRRAENPTPKTRREIELGIRGSQEADNFNIDNPQLGGGLYIRAHQRGGQQRLALELSADAVENDLLTQGALMLYLNPQGRMKPFALGGGGVSLTGELPLWQAGAGLDVEISQRFTVSADVRGIESTQGAQGVSCDDEVGCFTTFEFASYLIGNVGIARKF
jgi:hypothetical protein